MKPSLAMNAHRAEIRSIIETRHASNTHVFSSVATCTDLDNSDLDVLINHGAQTTLFDIGAIRHKLKQLLGAPVDVLMPNALPEKFRNAVISQALKI